MCSVVFEFIHRKRNDGFGRDNVKVLFGSGTISGPTADSCGCLLELTWNGRDPLNLGGGITRTFIEDGDRLTLHGWCQGKRYRVGLGSTVGTIRPAI